MKHGRPVLSLVKWKNVTTIPWGHTVAFNEAAQQIAVDGQPIDLRPEEYALCVALAREWQEWLAVKDTAPKIALALADPESNLVEIFHLGPGPVTPTYQELQRATSCRNRAALGRLARRVRAKLQPAGLTIHTITGRGYELGNYHQEQAQDQPKSSEK